MSPVQRVEDGVDPPEGLNQRGGGLVAHPGHAGQAIARVAAQHGEVGVGSARDPVALGHRSLVHDVQLGQATDGVDDPDRPLVVH